MVTRKINISVVIPLYNKERHIKRAIDSVISQTHQFFEVIIVDDGSTDDGLAKAREIEDGRIKIITQSNLGVSAARNKGISETKYNLIAFLDADDQWVPECLENFIRLAEKYPNVGMICAAFKIINSEEEVICPDFKIIPTEEGIVENFFKVALESPICASAMAIRKEVFNALGGFNLGMQYGEDAYMWSKIALNYPIAYINKYLANIYTNADNRASASYELSDDFPLFDYTSLLDIDVDNEDNYYMKEYIYKRYLLLAGRCLRAGDKRKAKTFISKAKPTKLFKDKYIRRKLSLYLSNPIGNIIIGILRKTKF